MGIIGTILSWLGKFLAPLFRVLIQEGKKPRDVQMSNLNEERENDIHNHINRERKETD